MAGLIAPAAAKPSLSERVRGWLAEQVAAQALRWRLWAPVAFGGGCGVYFALKAEPPLWPLAVFAVLAGGAWFAARRLGWPRTATLPLMLVACFALGLTVAKLRTEAVTAPIAPAMDEPTVIEGWVVDVDSPGEAGPRIVIAPVRIRGLASEETPVRLRATVRDAAAPEPGQAVRLFAILNPPPARPVRGPMISGATPSFKAWAEWRSGWGRRGRHIWSGRLGTCG